MPTPPPPPSLPALPDPVEPTRTTLQGYALAVRSIPARHAVRHPHWWHVGLTVRPDGLVTEPMTLPDGGAFHLRMDLRRHVVVVDPSRLPPGGELSVAVPMDAGLTAGGMGDRLLETVGALGLARDVDRSRFDAADSTGYVPETAAGLFDVLVAMSRVFELRRAELPGDPGPVHVWPHHFDLSFEWFGTRVVTGDEGEAPAQLSLGFVPTGPAYLYSIPWPFDPGLLENDLPAGAHWNTEGWQGAALPYDEIAGRPDGVDRVLAFARRVFDLARPTLTSDDTKGIP
jgi:hypothetical protein